MDKGDITIIICIIAVCLVLGWLLYTPYTEGKARTEFCISHRYLGSEYSGELNEYVCYKYVKDPSVDVGYLKIRSGVIPDEMIFQEDD